MKKKKKKFKISKITSGNAVVDWVFQMVCHILEKEDIQVVVLKRMRRGYLGFMNYPNTCGHKHAGYCIHLYHKLSQRGKWKVFFHELLHILLEIEKTPEKFVNKGEGLLWRRMNEEQKQIIAWYMNDLLKKD